MNLIGFKELLETVCAEVYHVESEEGGFPRITYAETGRKYYHADNTIQRKWFFVEVHLYTIEEFDPMFEVLEDLFAENGITFDLEAIEYGTLSGHKGVTHYFFKCEV